MLGFEAERINKNMNIFKNMVNVIVTNKIFIKCNVIDRAIYQGLHSDVIYLFGNTSNHRYAITIDRSVKRYAKLIVKKFTKMRISFRDENNLSINFLESPISLIKITEF